MEGSVVYAYLLLYQISGNSDLLKYAEKHIQIGLQLAEEDIHYDLLSGNAGWIIVLTKLYEITGKDKYLLLAADAGEILWRKRTETIEGIGWKCAGQDKMMAGMSHGNSGFILAFSYLLEHTDQEIYAERIWKLLQYEDSLYSEEKGNWKDLRKEGRDSYRANVWCHGGSGILLARLRLWRLEQFRKAPRIQKDLERGIKCLLQWDEKKDCAFVTDWQAII